MLYTINAFRGLDQSANEFIVPDGCSPDAENVSTRDGALRVMRRDAVYAGTALAGGIGTLCALYKRSGGEDITRLVAVNAARIAQWTQGAWQELYAGAGNGEASYLNYQKDGQDLLLIADGARGVLRWSGTGGMTSLSGCSKNFTQLALHYERVWGAGLSDEPDAVYWSRPYDPGNWTGDADNPDEGGGVLMTPTWNGGRVIAIRALFGDVLVFKESDLLRIVGTYPGDYEVVAVNGIVGPVARNSIAADATACYFLSRDGLCAYNGMSVARLGDEAARGVFARVNPAAAAGAAAALFADRLYLALPLDGAQENSAVLEADLKRGGFLLRTGVSVKCFLPFAGQLLYAGADGKIYAYGAGSAGGMDAYWRTPRSFLGSSETRKRFLGVSMLARGRFDLTVEGDDSLCVKRLELGPSLRPVSVRVGGGGRTMRMKFSNVDGSDFEIGPGLVFEAE